jgi:hypothetical protein
MYRVLLVATALATLAAPAFADNYPVSGRWGPSTGSDKGAIDCSGKRVIAFNGDQRTDSNGGVPAYRNKSVTANGASRWRVEDVFTTGQISNAHATYTLQQVDDDHIVMDLQSGGSLKLQRCR